MPSLAFTRLARMPSSNPFRWAVCADLGAVDEMRNARKSRSMESGNRHWSQPRGDPETRNHAHSETRSKFIILNSARLFRLCRLRSHMRTRTSCMRSARGQLPTVIAIKSLAGCYALHYSQHDGQGKATTTTQTYRKEERNNGLCVKGSTIRCSSPFSDRHKNNNTTSRVCNERRGEGGWPH